MSNSPTSGLGDLSCNYKPWILCGYMTWKCNQQKMRKTLTACGIFFPLAIPFSVMLFIPFYSCLPGFLWKYFIKSSFLDEDCVPASVSIICTRSGCSHTNWIPPCVIQVENNNFFHMEEDIRVTSKTCHLRNHPKSTLCLAEIKSTCK